MCRTSFVLFLLGVLAVVFSGCAVSASGNLLGEAAVTRFSTKEKKFRFVEAGMTYGATNTDYISLPHYSEKSLKGKIGTLLEISKRNHSFKI